MLRDAISIEWGVFSFQVERLRNNRVIAVVLAKSKSC